MDKLIAEIVKAAQAKIAKAKESWPKDAVHPDLSPFVRAAVDPRKDEIIEAVVGAVLAEMGPAAKKKA